MVTRKSADRRENLGKFEKLIKDSVEIQVGDFIVLIDGKNKSNVIVYLGKQIKEIRSKNLNVKSGFKIVLNDLDWNLKDMKGDE